MTVRVGLDAAIDEASLEDFTKEVQLVQIAEKPQGEVEIDFWVRALRHILPPEVTLCDARGVHDIPTAE